MTPRALLVTTNGAGMGHLARMTAVALAGIRTGTIEPTIMTLSVAAPLAANMGVPVEYCPSSARRWQPYWAWDAYFRDRLAAILTHGHIDVVMFDGVMPYDGLLAAMGQFPDVKFAWCRRGFWRSDAKVTRRALDRSRYFDAVIEPGDLAGDDHGPTSGMGAQTTAPVSLLSEVSAMTRRDAREQLGLDTDARLLFFSFGSGLSGDSKALLQEVLDAASANGWQVVATRPWRAEHEVAGVIYIDRVFPLVRFIHAFDAVVTSAGYNSVHEYVAASVPTLVVANSTLVTDDQSARANGVSQLGLALAAGSVDDVSSPLTMLLNGWQPPHKPGACDGSAEIAAALAGLATTSTRREPNRLGRKLRLLAATGPWLIGPARRLLGKVSRAIPVAQVSVTGDVSALAKNPPNTAIEHIADLDPSGGYGHARRELAARVYPSRL